MNHRITDITSATQDEGARYDRRSELAFIVFCVPKHKTKHYIKA